MNKGIQTVSKGSTPSNRTTQSFQGQLHFFVKVLRLPSPLPLYTPLREQRKSTLVVPLSPLGICDLYDLPRITEKEPFLVVAHLFMPSLAALIDG